jgi:hypothetical protein
MLRSILVSVPNRADAREIMQETAVALWRQFESYNPDRPTINGAMGYSRIQTRRFLAPRQRRAQLTTDAMEVIEQEMESSPETGGGTNRIKHGRLIILPKEDPSLSNYWLNFLQQAGVETPKFNYSDGEVSDLLS